VVATCRTVYELLKSLIAHATSKVILKAQMFAWS